MIITVSNLFPRPDKPTCGMYNYRLFQEMAVAIGIQNPESRIQNLCLVPSWKIWRWPAIRRWREPETIDHRPETIDRMQGEANATKSKVYGLRSNVCGLKSEVSLDTRYLPVFTLPLIGRSINWWFYLLSLRHFLLESEGHGLKSDVSSPTFYVPWLYPDGVAVARAIRGSGARLWLMALGSDTFHLQSSPRRRKILEACTQAEGIVCVAQVLADRLAAVGVPREKLHVVPNGVDATLFRYRSKEETLDCRPQTTDLGDAPSVLRSNACSLMSDVSPSKILFIGNLVPVKGPDVMLRAFATLSQTIDHRPQSPDPRPKTIDRKQAEVDASRSDVCGLKSKVSLLIIGSGPLRAQLERQARKLGIADRVHFLGNRPHAEVALWMNVADVLCLASRNEGMPNVVLEARASGLPVVATPAGAIPELPLDKEHFLVVKSCSPEDLAVGLREMLGRDLSSRKPDPAISTWGEVAERILRLIQAQAMSSV